MSDKKLDDALESAGREIINANGAKLRAERRADEMRSALKEAREVIIGFAVDFMAKPAEHSTVLKIDALLAPPPPVPNV